MLFLILSILIAAEQRPNIRLAPQAIQLAGLQDSSYVFDFPMSYNQRVQYWIQFFQKNQKKYFAKWLLRSQKDLPIIQKILKQYAIPLDMAFVAMIESGFSRHATSHASAVGPWQFITQTGQRYGLNINWWLDERRDLEKSTHAAAKYFQDLYSIFGSWYLALAAYNTGENRVRRMVLKYKTKDFWTLTKKSEFVQETRDYVPKFLAAVLIAKSPKLYGFNVTTPQISPAIDHFYARGGMSLEKLSQHLNISPIILKDLNPELLRGMIPEHISQHPVRIPKGQVIKLSHSMRQDEQKE